MSKVGQTEWTNTSVLAHMWLNIAGANGDETARETRDKLEGEPPRVFRRLF